MAEEMKRMRAQMEEDEQVASLMRGLRGQNLSDELFASADTQLRLVEVGSLLPNGLPSLFVCLFVCGWHAQTIVTSFMPYVLRSNMIGPGGDHEFRECIFR